MACWACAIAARRGSQPKIVGAVVAEDMTYGLVSKVGRPSMAYYLQVVTMARSVKIALHFNELHLKAKSILYPLFISSSIWSSQRVQRVQGSMLIVMRIKSLLSSEGLAVEETGRLKS